MAVPKNRPVRPLIRSRIRPFKNRMFRGSGSSHYRPLWMSTHVAMGAIQRKKTAMKYANFYVCRPVLTSKATLVGSVLQRITQRVALTVALVAHAYFVPKSLRPSRTIERRAVGCAQLAVVTNKRREVSGEE